MPSQLVTDVRQLITDRTEAGLPLTALERTFLLAAIAPRSGAGTDVVEELDAAITYGRRVLLAEPPAGTDPTVVAQRRREAATRLLAAARAAIDFDPTVGLETEADAEPVVAGSLPPDPRPKRLDVDG